MSVGVRVLDRGFDADALGVGVGGGVMVLVRDASSVMLGPDCVLVGVGVGGGVIVEVLVTERDADIDASSVDDEEAVTDDDADCVGVGVGGGVMVPVRDTVMFCVLVRVTSCVADATVCVRPGEGERESLLAVRVVVRSFVSDEVSDGVMRAGGVMVTVNVGRSVGVCVAIGDSLPELLGESRDTDGVRDLLRDGSAELEPADSVSVTVVDGVRDGLERVSVTVKDTSDVMLGRLLDGVCSGDTVAVASPPVGLLDRDAPRR